VLPVTKTVLPEFEEYLRWLRIAWDKGYITNNGELVLRLEGELRQFLQSPHLWYCSNGTIVLQMAIKGLQLQPGDEIITTPYSYVATANAIAWEQCRPVFADVLPDTCCIDPLRIEAAIGPKTRAILATHVYGLPCRIDAIEQIAQQHNLSVVYDGAHAFGVQYRGRSLLSYGHLSTCSFHATKLFHTVEGGCVIAQDEALSRRLELFRQFGHIGEEYFDIGINAKNSELHAAMGLAMLPRIADMIAERQQLFAQYEAMLEGSGLRWLQPRTDPELQWNYSYFPVFFENEAQALRVRSALVAQQIFPRRYFHPSLNTLPFYGTCQPCPISEQLAATVLCFPFFNGLTAADQERVVGLVRRTL
jgi:dTDP-4-amino-4,6-dideoxygalactose transaminase